MFFLVVLNTLQCQSFVFQNRDWNLPVLTSCRDHESTHLKEACIEIEANVRYLPLAGPSWDHWQSTDLREAQACIAVETLRTWDKNFTSTPHWTCLICERSNDWTRARWDGVFCSCQSSCRLRLVPSGDVNKYRSASKQNQLLKSQTLVENGIWS